MKRRIAIIGCGYVGSALGKTLADAGHDVIGTTTSPSRVPLLQQFGMRAEIAAIADVDRLCDLLADRDAVYLTIAPKAPGADYSDVYLKAARHVAEVATNAQVSRIIYTSSTRVYGQSNGQWVDETSPTDSSDERGQILVASEQTLLRLGSQCPTTVVRLSGIYGPDRDPQRRILSAAGTQRDDGDVWVNMIHRDDIVCALAKLLETEHHGVLNLSDDRPAKRSEFYDRIVDQAQLPPIRWRRHELSPRKGKRVSNEQIKALLNLDLTHPTH